MTTLWPLFNKMRAVSKPRPDVEPVITTTSCFSDLASKAEMSELGFVPLDWETDMLVQYYVVLL